MDLETTYRVVDLANRENQGQTAATPDLAKLATQSITRDAATTRLALERTDWVDDYGKPKPRRSVIIEAENPSEPWSTGA
jgi:hypothetical protein